MFAQDLRQTLQTYVQLTEKFYQSKTNRNEQG